ncbi:MAG TPA: vWA domain-containing protein [Acidimicrobiales bacterium]|nr:vWA domain-containing protein [Acidimicrobiales bacterium]
MSPAPGRLDQAAFDDALGRNPDETLSLLADMASATDPVLRQLARRLAGRIVVRLGRSGPPRVGAGGRLTLRRGSGADLDVDASLEELVSAAAGRRPPSADDLRWHGWAKPASALCLVVDRSGSMGGARLASAALAAGAVAWRAPADYSVVAFSSDVVVIKGQGEERSVEEVVDDLLALRGHGPTDLGLGLSAARDELARSTAGNQAVLLLSDCRATKGDDPIEVARALPRLLVLAPAGDSGDAQSLARATGARMATVAGPASVPSGLAELLG